MSHAEDILTARLDPPTCNGTPPRGLKDPLIRRWFITKEDEKAAKEAGYGFRSVWERTIRDHIQLDPTVGYIAMLVATHTDYDTGRNAWPGEVRLARYTGRTTRTVRASLAWLDEHGILTKEYEGRRAAHRSFADVYCLSIPTPLAATLGMCADRDHWCERGRLATPRPLRGWLQRAA